MTNHDDASPLARRSAPLLLQLAALPRWIFVIVPAALLLTALLVKGVVGALLLLLLASFVVWLLALRWSSLPATGRLFRLLVPVALLLIGASMILRPH